MKRLYQNKKQKRYLCPICKKEITLDSETMAEVITMAKCLAVNFFRVKYKDVALYCCNPYDYEWKLRYRGVIPVRVK